MFLVETIEFCVRPFSPSNYLPHSDVANAGRHHVFVPSTQVIICHVQLVYWFLLN